MADLLLPLFRIEHALGLEVPVPEADLAALQRERQPFLRHADPLDLVEDHFPPPPAFHDGPDLFGEGGEGADGGFVEGVVEVALVVGIGGEEDAGERIVVVEDGFDQRIAQAQRRG